MMHIFLCMLSVMVSQKVVTPAKVGVQVSHKFLKTLDSGLAVIPDSDPGRNDKKGRFLTFYETIKTYFARVQRFRVHRSDLPCFSEPVNRYPIFCPEQRK